ncbi:WxL domain-containing protein [Enterococcus mundtii]|uniref:WxL domain-containing protein n=1 Tax=Enterococcus mundtii TaxID=53346 RepID=UPI00321B0216
MKSRKIDGMSVLNVAVLSLQLFFMPLVTVYGETSAMKEEATEQVELPAVPNCLETPEEKDPLFSFTQSQLQGSINAPINVMISSDQAVSEVRVRLPEGAHVLSEQLPLGISMEQEKYSQEWVIQTQYAQTEFFFFLVFEYEGNYELSIGDVKTIVEVSNKKYPKEEENVSEELDEATKIEEAIIEMEPDKYGIPSTSENILSSQEDIVSFNLGPNLFQNPEFRYSNVNGGKIIDWEMAGSNLLVSTMNRNLTFNGLLPTNPTWFRTSDDRFIVGGEATLNNQSFIVSSSANTSGIVFLSQTIDTVPGRTYQIQAQNRLGGTSSEGTQGSFSIRVYNGNSEITGNTDLINWAEFDSTNTSTSRSLDFKAIENQTTISFRLPVVGQSAAGQYQQILRSPTVSAINKNLTLKASPDTGGTPKSTETSITPEFSTTIMANPNVGYRFSHWEIISGNGGLIENTHSMTTKFTMGDEDTVVQAVYEKKLVNPVDPLEPDVEVDPENRPELPEEQGLLSIDFVSRFDFGHMPISVNDQTYYARAQRLLNEDGSVNEVEERPNYIQVSDRRAETERHGWRLAVTQNGQFKNNENHELNGTQLHLTNQQIASTHGGGEPVLTHPEGIHLIPDQKTELLSASKNQGTDTWIYRFGNENSARKSVALEVPITAAPRAATYQTTLTWELSVVPENE